ncbi:MAG TPA: hypothetical protein VG845_05605, partial [Dehalococcoidia bacterium]|nr:hypothetical protein [Dehalococcoidia bacterium]
EIYRVDGIERLRRRYFGTYSVMQIEIEDDARSAEVQAGGRPPSAAKKHVLEIVINSLPWWRGHASLDGQTVVADLFPAERKIGLAMYAVLVLLVVATVLVFAWGAERRGMLRGIFGDVAAMQKIDIGRPSRAVPVTPPCVRVRTRRFGWLSGLGSQLGKSERSKEGGREGNV